MRKIDFKNDWSDLEIQWGMNSSNGILHYGMNAGNNGIFDLKSKTAGMEYRGSIMFSDSGENVYGSRRDAGNFLAGAKAKDQFYLLIF